MLLALVGEPIPDILESFLPLGDLFLQLLGIDHEFRVVPFNLVLKPFVHILDRLLTVARLNQQVLNLLVVLRQLRRDMIKSDLLLRLPLALLPLQVVALVQQLMVVAYTIIFKINMD